MLLRFERSSPCNIGWLSSLVLSRGTESLHRDHLSVRRSCFTMRSRRITLSPINTSARRRDYPTLELALLLIIPQSDSSADKPHHGIWLEQTREVSIVVLPNVQQETRVLVSLQPLRHRSSCNCSPADRFDRISWCVHTDWSRSITVSSSIVAWESYPRILSLLFGWRDIRSCVRKFEPLSFGDKSVGHRYAAYRSGSAKLQTCKSNSPI